MADTADAAPAADAAGQPSPSIQAADMVALSVTPSVASDGGASTAPAAATAPASSGSGKVYYVDSQSGDDGRDGLSSSAAGAGKGPWRSLARVAAVTLAPGDTVRLVCGSRWNETLRVTASGTAGNPITVASYPAGCASPAAIDGATTIEPSAWSRHAGNIYKATLSSAPLQVFASTGAMTLAHHPNRGFDPAQADSMYLKVAADSATVTVNGRAVSRTVVTGADLVLPAGVALQAGTGIRIRTVAWYLDETTIASVSGSTITLSSATAYPVTAGWGYFLTGQLWMLDSPGEWHHDAASKTLYAWMPDSGSPSNAISTTSLATGIDLQARQYITVDGVAVRHVGVGINARRSTGIIVRNARIEDTVGIGIDAAASSAATVSANTIVRTGRDAVSGVDYSVGTATGMAVTGNSITDSGVVMSGENVLSLPVLNYAAIRAGSSATVSSNTITNAGYIGIWGWQTNTIADNVVSGSCTTLDDCGGIYVSRVDNKSTISNNLLLHARGVVAGKAAKAAYTQAQGIYLDESASGVTVSGNTASDNDYGIQMHDVANNTVTQNKLIGNRNAQLWLQETRSRDYSVGDVYANTITFNQIVPLSSSAKAVRLDTVMSDTAHFGRFDGNRYFDRVSAVIVDERTASSTRSYTLSQWKSAVDGAGTPRANDAAGWGASEIPFAVSRIGGSTIVPNGNLAASTKGWSTWNQTSPFGSLVREACAPGWCARYVTGGSAGILVSPNFSIIGGNWYRLTVDVSTGADGQSVDMVVRRGGGGTNGYESLSDRSLKLNANKAWARYTITFKASKTVNAADPLTGDLGARVDFQGVQPGQLLSVANLEIVPVTPADATSRSDLLLNAGAAPMQSTCPLAATQPAQCGNYLRLSDNAPVSWPYLVPARGSEIVYTRDPSLVDSDGDGIADSQDACPGTSAKLATDSRGCALLQR